MKAKKILKTSIHLGILLICFFAAQTAEAATLYPSGSLIISNGTVYRISESGQSLEAFDSAEKYYSYRYSFLEAVAATSGDLTLPQTIIPWGDGRLFLDQGIAYQVSGGEKHGFVSQDVFFGQGFKFSQAKVGSLNLPLGNNIEVASSSHLSGSFVLDGNGTVWYVTASERRGLPSVEHLRSWGLGFDEVVPANAADLAKPAGQLVRFRTGSLVNDQGIIWVVEGSGKKAFPSAECFTNFGFNFQFVVKGSLLGYQDNGTICGPIPPISYERKVIVTDRGNFTIDILKVDLAGGDIKAKTYTANNDDCLNNCPVKPLLAFVNENQGVAGINGSYFCPESYPECSGKINSFYWKVYNSALNKMINANSGIKDDKPFMAFDSSGSVRFFNRYQDFVSANLPITAGISNEPLLISGKEVVVTDNILDTKERTVKSNRGAVGVNGQTIYAVVARSATVMDLAFIMKALGVSDAFNLDGGGSSALVYDGTYKVGPGRAIPNALVFVRK